MGSELRRAAPAHATGAVVFVPLDEVADDETFRVRGDGDVSLLASSIGRLGQLAPVELRPWAEAAPDGDGPRWQVVAGFRRLSALKLLFRERVLARIHESLSDDDAWALALAPPLTSEPLCAEELESLRTRIEASGVASWAPDLIDEALVRAPLPAELREQFYEFLKGPLPAAPDGGEPEGEEPARAAPPAGAAEPASAPSTRSEHTPEEKPVAEAEALAAAPPEEVEEVAPEDFAHDLAVRMAELNQDLATAYGAWADIPEEGRRLLLVQARYVAELLPYLERTRR